VQSHETAAGEEKDETYRRDLRLGYLVHDVSRMRRRAFDQMVAPLGATRAQWWVLAFLARQDGISQTHLSEVLDLGKAALGSLLDRLEAGEWVERRVDSVDRRTKKVFLTRKSSKLLKDLRSVEREFNDRILGDLSSEERYQMIRLLTKLKVGLAHLISVGGEKKSERTAKLS